MKKTILLFAILVSVVSAPIFADTGSEGALSQELEELRQRTQDLERELDRLLRQEGETFEDVVLAQKVQWGRGIGLELSGGLMGVGALGTLGFSLPKITFGNDGAGGFLGGALKLSVVSDSVPVRIFDAGSLQHEDSRFHLMAGPSITFGSPLFLNFVRMYGGIDLYLGTVMTVTNSYDANLFTGGLGYGGVEIYSSAHTAFYIECGGGGGGMVLPGSNPVVAGAGYLGGGFVRVGSRFFL